MRLKPFVEDRSPVPLSARRRSARALFTLFRHRLEQYLRSLNPANHSPHSGFAQRAVLVWRVGGRFTGGEQPVQRTRGRPDRPRRGCWNLRPQSAQQSMGPFFYGAKNSGRGAPRGAVRRSAAEKRGAPGVRQMLNRAAQALCLGAALKVDACRSRAALEVQSALEVEWQAAVNVEHGQHLTLRPGRSWPAARNSATTARRSSRCVKWATRLTTSTCASAAVTNST